MFYCVSEEIDLFLHQISDNSCIYIFCHTYIGAVRSVSCTKRIVYEYIAERSKLLAEFIFILCLFCAVTCIFKKNYISVIHCFYCSLCVWSYYFRICCKFHFLSK